MKIINLPKMMPDEECQALVKWVDGLEIQQLKELKELFEIPKPVKYEIRDVGGCKRREVERRGWEAVYAELQLKFDECYDLALKAGDTRDRYHDALEQIIQYDVDSDHSSEMHDIAHQALFPRPTAIQDNTQTKGTK